MAIDETTRSGVEVATKHSAEPPPDQGSELTVLDLFKRIYQFFYSKTVGLIIILAMAVLVLIGVLLPQAGAGVYADAEAHAAFVEQQTARLGAIANVADALGFFRVFSSPLFLGVTALLALSIIACTVHRIPQLWQRYRHPRTHVSDRFFAQARYRGTFETDMTADAALAAVRARAAAKHYRVLPDAQDPAHGVYLDRFGWGGFGTVVAHASFIIILAAFVISGSGGIDDLLYVPVGGDGVEVGHGTGLNVAATSFDAPVNDEGRATDYVSHLIVRAGDAVAGEADVRVNEPLRVAGIKLHQSTFGIAADVTVADSAGKQLYGGSVPLSSVTSDGATTYGRIELADAGYDLIVFTPASGSTASGLAPGEAAFQLHQAGQADAVAMKTAQQGSPVSLGDLTVTFEREREYAGIGVRQDPGAIWMWIGSALLVLGMTVTFACRHRRVWLRVETGQRTRLRFASNDKEDLAFERQFERLVYDMNAVLREGAGSLKEATT